MAVLSGSVTGGDAALAALRPEETAEAACLSASVGWNQVEADWRRLVASPEGVIGARVGGELVGTATLVRHGPRLAWLGMVIVREDLRGRGLGGRLVDAALAGWRAPPYGAVGLDATDMGAPVYARRGFEPVAAIDRWVGVIAAPGAAGRAREAGPDDLAAVARLDAAATGVDRGRLLGSLLDERGTAGLVVVEGGEARAFAFLREGRERPHLGPVVADDETALLEVLAAAAERAVGREVNLDAVRSERRSALLTRLGLRPARSLTRMLRPARPELAMLDERVLAATAFEWG